MKLRKPPVIEAWIEFRFELTEDVGPWDVHEARRFLERYYEGIFEPKLVGWQHQVVYHHEANKPPHGKASAQFTKLRASNVAEDRYLQVGRDTVALNVLKKNDREWPAFSAWRDEAIVLMMNYIEFVQQRSVLSVQPALHYRDVVPLPLTGGKLEPKDYLNIYPEVPAPIFGDVNHFFIGLVFGSKISEIGRTQLLVTPLEREESAAQNEHVRLQMDWHIVSTELQSPDQRRLGEWLDRADHDVVEAFKNVFTKAAWELFEPQDSE